MHELLAAESPAECGGGLDAFAPRFAEAAGDVQQIAGARAAAPQGLAAGGGSTDHDVAIDLSLCAKSPRQNGSGAAGESQESAIERGDDLLPRPGGTARDTRQSGARLPSGDVAQAAARALWPMIDGDWSGKK